MNDDLDFEMTPEMIAELTNNRGDDDEQQSSNNIYCSESELQSQNRKNN